MSNLNIDLNLMKLSRTGVASIHGVRCLIIPTDENDIFVSADEKTLKAKAAYLHLTAWENKNGMSQYGDTHHVSQSFSKNFRESNADFCKNAPIIGNGKPVQSSSRVETQNFDSQVDPNDDLPF